MPAAATTSANTSAPADQRTARRDERAAAHAEPVTTRLARPGTVSNAVRVKTIANGFIERSLLTIGQQDSSGLLTAGQVDWMAMPEPTRAYRRLRVDERREQLLE